jgi:hypothetical protein
MCASASVLMLLSESATALPMAIVLVMALASALVTVMATEVATGMALAKAARLSVPQPAARPWIVSWV